VAEGVHARGMRPRLVIPVLAALGLTVLTVQMSYGFAAEYGAIDGGPLAYFGIGLYIFWPVVVLVGALAGGVPYRLGERRAALPAGIALALVSVVGIGVAGALGTRAKAAQYPTSPACVAGEDATPEEVEAVEELEEALAGIDHPVRFEALRAAASVDHCQNAFAGGEGTDHWVEPYAALLAEEGWQVDTTDESPYVLLVATRGDFRIRIFVDDPGSRGLTTLRIERR
jgi:hypothetical protein